jgi:hypothetical protein
MVRVSGSAGLSAAGLSLWTVSSSGRGGARQRRFTEPESKRAEAEAEEEAETEAEAFHPRVDGGAESAPPPRTVSDRGAPVEAEAEAGVDAMAAAAAAAAAQWA